MAIDWGRMARGIATGYLGAKIANTEANDALNANIIERAGLNFYENTLPEWEAGEKVRKETYNKVSSRYGKDVANYMDQNGFTDYNEIVEMCQGARSDMPARCARAATARVSAHDVVFACKRARSPSPGQCLAYYSGISSPNTVSALHECHGAVSIPSEVVVMDGWQKPISHRKTR